MTIIEWLLSGIILLGNAWMVVLLVYNLFLSLFGFRRKGKASPEQAAQTRFLILVPAHNEEAVIADMVQNLAALDYPKELVDCYIIADNCTDRTAQIVREMGGQVIETHKESDDAPTGKPIALRKALEALPDYAERYDLLMIFDADNLMDADILRKVNDQYISENRPEIIQCYLGTKNQEGLVAKFYHATFTITNRFMCLARHRLGLNAAVGGTGFAVKTAYLKSRGGWTTRSLTEDFEMQVDVTLHGGHILWNHDARIYDEKPTNLLAAFRQNLRWSQGRWFVALRNTPKLLKEWIRHRLPFREMLSLLAYMYAMAAPVFLLFMLAVGAIKLVQPLLFGKAMAIAVTAAQVAADAGQPPIDQLVAQFAPLPSLLMFLYSFVLLYWWAERVDNKRRLRLRELPFVLVSYFINLINVSVAQVIGLLKYKQQNKWDKTRHKIRGHALYTSKGET
ncbi:MAG: glycosyltransferase family 2 protein [Oscillospiraceae bacterium]|nr:glycosyltransferase family 2 protein [Oscillospiraceae bacterium]